MLVNLLLNHLLLNHSVYSCKYAELMLLLCLYMFFFVCFLCKLHTHTHIHTWTHATSHTNHPLLHTHTQCPVSHGTVAARPNIWHCVRHWLHTWLHLVFLSYPNTTDCTVLNSGLFTVYWVSLVHCRNTTPSRIENKDTTGQNDEIIKLKLLVETNVTKLLK